MFLNLFWFAEPILGYVTIWWHPWLQYTRKQTSRPEIGSIPRTFQGTPVENPCSNATGWGITPSCYMSCMDTCKVWLYCHLSWENLVTFNYLSGRVDLIRSPVNKKVIVFCSISNATRFLIQYVLLRLQGDALHTCLLGW